VKVNLPNADKVISPELQAALERNCQKYDLLIEPVKEAVLEALFTSAGLDLVASGELEIAGLSKGKLSFKAP
jgi:hypothetical protein